MPFSALTVASLSSTVACTLVVAGHNPRNISIKNAISASINISLSAFGFILFIFLTVFWTEVSVFLVVSLELVELLSTYSANVIHVPFGVGAVGTEAVVIVRKLLRKLSLTPEAFVLFLFLPPCVYAPQQRGIERNYGAFLHVFLRGPLGL